jgi:ATP-dependent Clp protease ATP-binding subunit ClpA
LPNATISNYQLLLPVCRLQQIAVLLHCFMVVVQQHLCARGDVVLSAETALAVAAAAAACLSPQPQAPAEGESVLDRFTNDLTAAARRGQLDPLVGRDAELRRLCHILLRRTKNNPILVGESGVLATDGVVLH